MASISEALDLNGKEMVVLVGGGGKTTILNRLTAEALTQNKKAVITTTTKMYPPANCPVSSFVQHGKGCLNSIAAKVESRGRAVVGREINAENKIVGLPARAVDEIYTAVGTDILLVEGDGARGKPFKAPRQHEPVIPEKATVVIPVVGAECMGKPLTEQHFHAVGKIMELTGVEYGAMIAGKEIAEILLHSKGYMKGVPGAARWIPFINKIDQTDNRRSVLNLAHRLKDAGTEKVIIGSAIGVTPVQEVL